MLYNHHSATSRLKSQKSFLQRVAPRSKHIYNYMAWKIDMGGGGGGALGRKKTPPPAIAHWVGRGAAGAAGRIQLRMADMEMSQSTLHRCDPHKIQTEEMVVSNPQLTLCECGPEEDTTNHPIKMSASGRTLLLHRPWRVQRTSMCGNKWEHQYDERLEYTLSWLYLL